MHFSSCLKTLLLNNGANSDICLENSGSRVNINLSFGQFKFTQLIECS